MAKCSKRVTKTSKARVSVLLPPQYQQEFPSKAATISLLLKENLIIHIQLEGYWKRKSKICTQRRDFHSTRHPPLIHVTSKHESWPSAKPRRSQASSLFPLRNVFKQCFTAFECHALWKFSDFLSFRSKILIKMTKLKISFIIAWWTTQKSVTCCKVSEQQLKTKM